MASGGMKAISMISKNCNTRLLKLKTPLIRKLGRFETLGDGSRYEAVAQRHPVLHALN